MKDSQHKVPPLLYKFRNWKICNHRDTLRGELYFAAPSSFNDPFDCSIPTNYEIIIFDPEKRKECIKAIKERQGKEVSEQELLDPTWREKNAKIERTLWDNTMGVYCLSSVKNNIALWSHYANSHKGFCVGFDGELLSEKFKTTGDGNIFGFEVDYNCYPYVDPLGNEMDNFYKQIFRKSPDWECEKEVRFLMITGKMVRRLKGFGDCIKEVIMGCEMPESDKIELIEFVNVELPRVPIFQAKQKPHSFELEFRQINASTPS